MYPFRASRLRRTAIVTAGWTVIVASLFIPPTQGGEELMINGALHIRNPCEPPGGMESAVLEERWRLGGEEDDVFLGRIAGAVADAQGTIFLLDQGRYQVHVLSPEGRLLRSMSRQGEGPGEMRQPRDILLMPGGTVGVVDRFPGRIIKLTPDGTPAGTFRPSPSASTEGGFVAFNEAIHVGGHLVVGRFTSFEDPAAGHQTRVASLVGYDLEGHETVTYRSLEVFWEYRNLVVRERDEHWIFWRWAAGPDGRVAIPADDYRYALSVYNPDGTLDRVIERAYAPMKRSPEIIEELRDSFESSLERQMPCPVHAIIEKHQRDIISVRLPSDGSIWVLSSRGVRELPPDALRVYDVYDTAGHFVKQVALAGPGNPREDRVYFLDDRTLLQVCQPAGNDEASEMIICHQLVGATGVSG